MGDAKRRKAEIEKLKALPQVEDTTGVVRHRLYHGTVEPVAQAILSGQGLTPRGERPSKWQHAPSRADSVYLTDYYGVKYASDIQINTFMKTSDKKPRGAVVEVDMDRISPENLLADEDFMAKLHMMMTDQKEWSQEEFRRLETHYATHELEATRKNWRACLLHYGTVCHRGEIPRSAIARIALISLAWLGGLRYAENSIGNEEKLWEIHPNIHPETLTRTQKFHREMTHTVFDEPCPEIEVIKL